MFAAAGFATSILLAVVLGVIVLRTTFERYRQSARSMEPTIAKGDMVLVRRARTIRRGDVVVLVMPTDRGLAIKRVIALPGEMIELREGVAVVNGVTLEEPYISLREGAEPQIPVVRDTPAVQVPPDNLYVLGDNRDHSNDSRFFGPVRRNDIRGRVVVVLSEKTGIRRP